MSEAVSIQSSVAHGPGIAVCHLPGRVPGVLFCPGFMSDMEGTKARALEDHCQRGGRAFTRFDYSGHGQSGGTVMDGTIGGWLADTLAVIDRATDGKLLVVGTSMGGWLALLAALARPRRVGALLLLAPAPDFTEDILWNGFADGQRDRLMKEGHIALPSAYGDGPYIFTRGLIEEGRRHLLLGHEIDLDIPLRIIHGQADADVPWRHALRIVEKLRGGDVAITLVKSGDHRLSRPADIRRMTRQVDELLSLIGDRPPPAA